MSYVVVVLLSVLWLGFFLPSLLHARRTASPLASAETFRSSLAALGASPRRAARVKHARRRGRSNRGRAAARRRRAVLGSLLTALCASGAVGLSLGGAARIAPAAPALAVIAYVALLRAQASRRRPRVSQTPPALPATPEPPALEIIPSVGRRLERADALERIAG